MSLFDSITAPKWQHKNPEIRLAAAQLLDDPEVLLQLVHTDPDAAVQAAALARISAAETLDELIDTLSAPLLHQAKAQRLQQLLPQTEALAQISDDKQLLRIASLAADAELAAQAIAGITSTELRLEVASEHPIARVRLQATEGISDLAQLEQLMNRARGHDKAVYKHCKAVLDAHHAQEKAEQEVQLTIQNLLEKCATLAGSIDSLKQDSSCKMLDYQWQAVIESTNSIQREQFVADMARCVARLDELKAAEAAQRKAEQENESAREKLQDLVTELEALESGFVLPDDPPAIAEFSAQLDELETRFEQGQEAANASAEQKKHFAGLVAKLRHLLQADQKLLAAQPRIDTLCAESESVDASDYSLLQRQLQRAEKMLRSLNWPDSDGPQPEPITLIQSTLAKLKSAVTALEADQTRNMERAKTLTDKVRSKLEQKQTREADKALAKCRQVLRSLAPKPRQALEHELAPLAAQLQEIHDWNHFAIEPKKVELCASMTALIGGEQDVETLALKIQSLQEEWKQVGALPHAREQALWLKFKAAADEAWKPCKQAFSEQAKVQKANFKQRMALVDQLAEYESKMNWPHAGAESAQDGANPDWRMVQKTLDTARAAFRAISPLNSRDEHNSQKAFRAICDRIYGHVKDEYARNIALKESLVTQAEALAGSEDVRQSIETCKALQAKWKSAGITPVKFDRKLWNAFRAACDAVFAQMDEQRAQSRADQEAQVKQAEALRDQAKAALSAASGEEIGELNRTLADLKQQFNALNLPSALRQRLFKEFQDMERQARDHAVLLRKQVELASWNRLEEQLLAAAEAAGREASEPQASDLPKGVDQQVLSMFLEQGPVDADGMEAQLREACIALEVLGEIESPAGDKKARMQYQMQRLVAGIGNQQLDPEQALLDSINGFIALRPGTEWVERFFSGVKKIRGK